MRTRLVLVFVMTTAVAHADVPGAGPAVNPCKEEGFIPKCAGLPLEKGVCITVTPEQALKSHEMLTREGFTERCKGEFHYPDGPYRHQTCVHATREEWCRDTTLEGWDGHRAQLCDLESNEGCTVGERLAGSNPRVIAKTCVENAESLKKPYESHHWPKCRPHWLAKGIALPVAEDAGQGSSSSSGCKRCAIAPSGSRLAWLFVVGAVVAWQGRRRFSRV